MKDCMAMATAHGNDNTVQKSLHGERCTGSSEGIGYAVSAA
jgi:hypothetical protein